MALEDRWRAEGHGNVEIRANIQKSLNGRPYQQYIDPELDLTAVTLHPLRGNDWVLPLQIPVWGARDGHGARGIGLGS